MDVRIGVTQAPREINVEMSDEPKARTAFKTAVDAALAGTSKTLWLTDKKGREIAIPADKIAFVEIGSSDGDRRIGFGG
jgi:hypothetical protein